MQSHERSIMDGMTAGSAAARLNAPAREDHPEPFPEAGFDALVAAAAAVCETPIALIGLTDEDRQWCQWCKTIPDQHGVRETFRPRAFRDRTIRRPGLLEIVDAAGDPDFRNDPLVTGAPHIRFYAGVALRAPDGRAIGTVCVIDHRPRRLDGHRRRSLESLAAVATALLEDRRHWQTLTSQVTASDTRYRKLCQETPAMLHTIDREGRLVSVSQRWLQAMGYAHDEVIGRPSTDFLTPASRELAKALLSEFFASGCCQDVPYQFVTKRGEVMDVLLSATAERDGQGNIGHSLAVIVDVTERKRAERALMASEEKFRDFAAAGADWFWQTDAGGRFCWFSASVEQRVGVPVHRLLGRTREEIGLMPGGSSSATAQPDLCSPRPFRDAELRFEVSDGDRSRTLWIRSSGVPIVDGRGVFQGYRGSSTDITALKNAEFEHQRLQQQLVQASRLAGQAEIATGVLHNIGNVLNSLNISLSIAHGQLQQSRLSGLGQINVLLERHGDDLAGFFASDPKARQLPAYLRRLDDTLRAEHAALDAEFGAMHSGMAHLKRIVSAQQSMAGRFGVVEPAVLGDLVDEVLALTVHECHGIAIERDYRVAAPVTIDRQSVLQILINLVNNGKEALLDSGSEAPRLAVTVAADDDAWQIRISDNGPGLTPEQRRSVFEFGYTTKDYGHGYGLHASATQAQAMGGNLTCSSAGPGRGTTFTLRCPWRPRQDGAGAEPPPPAPRVAAPDAV